MQRLVLTTLAAQDISTPLLVQTYTADADRLLYWQVYLGALAGQGVYKACATKRLLGAGTVYQSPTSAAGLATGVFTAYLPGIAVPVKNTDVVKIYVQGLLTDNSVDVNIEIWDATALAPGETATIGDVTLAALQPNYAPLLTSDARLNNLDSQISIIPTNPLLDNDVRLTRLDASISTIPALLAARVLEGTITWEQAFRLVLDAVAVGDTVAMDTALGHIRDLANSKDRIRATLDGLGNRTVTFVDGT